MGGQGSGRPKAAAVHVMEGTFEASRHGRGTPSARRKAADQRKAAEHARRLAAGLVEGPPGHLQPLVGEIWEELAAQTSIPASTATGFEVLCTMLAEFRSNPARMNSARVMVLRGLLNDFGMTAAASERLGLGLRQRPEDDLERLLATG
jgi:hypothetical protein